MSKITEKQSSYLTSLVNQATGKSYKFVSQITEDGIGKQAKKVQGMSSTEASALIDKWKKKAEKKS